MARTASSSMVRLRSEALETRVVPTVLHLQYDFETAEQGTVPVGWQQWSSHPNQGFVVGGEGRQSDQGLLSDSKSNVVSRLWSTEYRGTNARIAADVFVDGLVPATLFVRGHNVDTELPSYYAVTITRGLEVQLQRVENGVATLLYTAVSKDWISQEWLRVTLSALGNVLAVEVYRSDSGEYLNGDGTWQVAPTCAICGTDSVLTEGEYVGLARPARVAGAVLFDNLRIGEASETADRIVLRHDDFDEPTPTGMPTDWRQWSNNRAVFQFSSEKLLSGPYALSVTGTSAGQARSWLDSALPRDVQVSASVWVNSLIPAQVFARGQNLETDSPSYYAASIQRGLRVSLLRVQDGIATELAALDTAGWQTNQWMQVTISTVNSTIGVKVQRLDTNQYLQADGSWRTDVAWALQVTDATLNEAGKAGVARSDSYAGTLTFENFLVTSAAAASDESRDRFAFDGNPNGSLPPGWNQWSRGAGGFQVAALTPSPTVDLASFGTSDSASRAWMTDPFAADVAVTASIFLNGLIPAQLFVRGSGVDSQAFSGYAVSIRRGVEVQLLRYTDGEAVVLAHRDSIGWQSNQWVEVTLAAAGNTLRVRVQRADTGEFLATDGSWQTAPVDAVTVTDESIRNGGFVGVGRTNKAGGRIIFSDVRVEERLSVAPPPSELPPPPQPTAPNPPASSPTVPNDPLPLPPPSPPTAPATPPTPTPEPSAPQVPRNFNHIRIAQLAYYGTPITEFEQKLIRDGVDLIIPNITYLDRYEELNPETAKLIYSNVSNMYLGLITDWNEFADRNGYDREAPYFHVTAPTPFTGDSSSSRPVSWFWFVRKEGVHRWWDHTRAARREGENFSLGEAGESVYVGYPEMFRELNLQLQRGASAGWSAVFEYPTAVDAEGSVIAWRELTLNRDTTNGFRGNGQITFDPPGDWVPGRVESSEYLYFVRIRTKNGGTAPVVMSLTGRDYVGANGRTSGVIPAFDYKADRDGDGYLSDAEFARRQNGMDARFVYESRVFYPAYGQNRFATNPASEPFRAWAVRYTQRFLAAHPHADGVFMDNSLGRLAITRDIREKNNDYAANYATLLATIQENIGNKWILANTAGGRQSAHPIAAAGVSFLEEFGLRPLAFHWLQFDELGMMIETRLELLNGRGYAVIDTHPMGGDPLDPRTQLATLSAYYMIADPKQTFLLFNGGYEPASSWQRHWTEAVRYDVGAPLAPREQFAVGQDPANRSLQYVVFGREYEKALVLFKPLSYTRNITGTTGANTATTHELPRAYREVRADGSLGPTITSIRLRNGEGAILVPA